MMDRYGEEIEFDFHQFGVDVVDFFRVDQVDSPDGARGKRRLSLRKFRALLGQLPQHGRYHAKLADDDEWVAQQMEYIDNNPELKKQLESQRRNKPTLDGYTEEVKRLDRIEASLKFLTKILDNAYFKGKNTKQLPSVVPPETARDRYEARKARAKSVALDQEIREAQQNWARRQERLAREAASNPAKNLPPRDALGRFVKRT